jgi:hypothetical protein
MRSVRPRCRSLEAGGFPWSTGKKSRFGEAKNLHHNGLGRQTFYGFDPHTPVRQGRGIPVGVYIAHRSQRLPCTSSTSLLPYCCVSFPDSRQAINVVPS